MPGLMTIGRTEPAPRDVERTARALFNADIAELEIDPKKAASVSWPQAEGFIKLRDGTKVAVRSSRHPDPHVEEVRRQICEAQLVQAIGRGRGGTRTEDTPLAIDILTCIPCVTAVDEVTTWEEIQPSFARIMWSRGALPLSYRDMADAYPDLFVTPEAARKALQREVEEWAKREPEGQNPGQTPIDIYYYIRVCPGFSLVHYRRTGSRGPAGRLLYDAERIDPVAWLAERLDATVSQPAEKAPARPARRGLDLNLARPQPAERVATA